MDFIIFKSHQRCQGMFIGYAVSLSLYVEISPGLDQWNMRFEKLFRVLYVSTSHPHIDILASSRRGKI